MAEAARQYVREWRVEIEGLPDPPSTPIWAQTRRWLYCGVDIGDGRKCGARAVWRQLAQPGGFCHHYPRAICTMHKREGEVKDDFNI